MVVLVPAWARGEMKYRKTCVFQLSCGIFFGKVVRPIVWSHFCFIDLNWPEYLQSSQQVRILWKQHSPTVLRSSSWMMSPSKVPEVFNNEFTIIIIITIIIIAVILNVTTFMIIIIAVIIGNGIAGPAEQI